MFFKGRDFTCPRCLARIRMDGMLARCERGCKMMAGAAGSATTGSVLIFDPRETSAGRGRGSTGRSAEIPCPRCRRATTVMVCPACRGDLPREGLGLPVVSVVVVGPLQSGKTAFVTSAHRVLETRIAPASGFVVDPWPTNVSASPERAGDAHRSMHVNPLGQSITAQIARIQGTGARSKDASWLSVFDTPGQAWEERSEDFLNRADFVPAAGAILLLLDPTRLAPVETALRRRAALTDRAGTPWERPLALHRRLSVVDEIRHLAAFFGRRGISLPTETSLGLVLTKFDLWGDVAPEGTLIRRMAEAFAPAGLGEADAAEALHQEAEALLTEWSGDTLPQQLDLKFRETRCFVISALGEQSRGPRGRAPAFAPFGIEHTWRWALTRQGVRLLQ